MGPRLVAVDYDCLSADRNPSSFDQPRPWLVNEGQQVGSYRAAVLRSRIALVCSESAVRWWDGEDLPSCLEPTHVHQRFEVHVHRDLVRLPDNATVVAASFDEIAPYHRDTIPQFGVYLDRQWEPPWRHEVVEWPDFGLPTDDTAFVDTLRRLHERALVGQTVELGCLGGHGRTGTALACLAVLAGVRADHATAWTRENYCSGAVETPEQERFVTAFHPK